MTNPQAPPYPGFAPYVTPGYPQPQFPYPEGQPYMSPGQQYPAGQPYPLSGQQYPAGQPYPSTGQQYPAGQYLPNANNAGFASYGSPVVYLPGPMNFGAEASVKLDDALPGWSGFTDKAVRAVFVRKVYSILSLQLSFTVAVIALCLFEPNTQFFVRRNPIPLFFLFILFVVMLLALCIFGNLRRQYPINMIFLAIFTISMSTMLGAISDIYSTVVLLMCVGICAVVCLAVSVFSFYSKFNFTTCGAMLFMLLWVLILAGIIHLVTHGRYIIMTIYAACGALIFLVLSAYHAQLLMGGNRCELNPEEHIFAVIQIYLDILCIYIVYVILCGPGR